MPAASGTWYLPCDGKSSLDIECSIKCTIGADGQPVYVPIWIGNLILFPFVSIAFIEGEMLFVGQPGQKLETTFKYRIMCDKKCTMTASVVSGGGMTKLDRASFPQCLSFGYKDPNDSIWYYTPVAICVTCDKSRTVKLWKQEPRRLAGLGAVESRRYLAQAEKEGYLILTDMGRKYLTQNVALRSSKGPAKVAAKKRTR